MNLAYNELIKQNKFFKRKPQRSKGISLSFFTAVSLSLFFALTVIADEKITYDPYDPIVTSVLGEIDTLDGAKAYNWDNFTLAQFIYAGLLRWNPETEAIEGDIASDWSISEDGKLWNFTLRDGAYFHDGSQIQVDDVIHSFNRIASPQTESPFSSFLSNVVGYKAVSSGKEKTLRGIRSTGARSLEIELLRADAGFEKVLSTSLTAIMPGNPKGLVDIDRLPIGSGAYRVTENSNRHVLLELSPSYNHLNPHPASHIEVRKNTSAYAAVRGIENGEIHYSVLYHMPRDVALLFEHPLYEQLFVHQPANSTVYLALNTQRPALKDARVRRALDLAVNREQLVKHHLKISATPTNTILPIPMRHRSMARGGGLVGRYTNKSDLSKSRELLQEANFDHSKPLTMIALSAGANENVAYDLVNMLSNVDVQVVLDALPSEEFHQRAQAGEDDLIFSDGAAWFADFDDPSNYYFPLFSQSAIPHYNWSKLDLENLDREAHRINAMIHEPDERNDAWIDLFERIQHQYVPWIPLYHRHLYLLIDDPEMLAHRNARSYDYKIQFIVKDKTQQTELSNAANED